LDISKGALERGQVIMQRDFQNDADGDALQRIKDHGSDMSQPMKIDFHVEVPDKAAGKLVAEAAREMGFLTKLVDDDPGWTCWCTKEMLATYDGVIAIQKTLDGISRAFGGNCEAWGTSGNGPNSFK
jgi:hypothetical protein